MASVSTRSCPEQALMYILFRQRLMPHLDQGRFNYCHSIQKIVGFYSVGFYSVHKCDVIPL